MIARAVEHAARAALETWRQLSLDARYMTESADKLMSKERRS